MKRATWWLWALLVVAGGAQALDKGEAYAQVMAQAQASYKAMSAQFQSQRKVCGWFSNNTGTGIAYGAVLANTANCGLTGNATAWGTTYTLYQANYSGACTTREKGPGGAGKLFVSTPSLSGVCYQGCWYAMGQESTKYKLGAATKSVMTSTGLTPDGGVCADLTSPSIDDQCVPDGTLTQCVKPDGSHCSSASNGKQFCWGKDEAGVKVAPSGNEAATKSPEGAGINAPRTPPKNGGDWQVVGQSTTSITNNNTTTNYNTTNFQSSYGPSGNGGSGSGSGGDGGSGDGGDGGDDGGDDGGNDPGGVGSGVGELYTPSGQTVQTVLGPYYSQVMAVPIVAGLTHFMGVQGGGSCPVFTVEASRFWSAMSYSAHCSGEFLTFLRACGWVLFAAATYLSVKIAVT